MFVEISPSCFIYVMNVFYLRIGKFSNLPKLQARVDFTQKMVETLLKHVQRFFGFFRWYLHWLSKYGLSLKDSEGIFHEKHCHICFEKM